MNESSKSEARRRAEGFYERYLSGSVLDIGCGSDLVVPHARGWDLPDGDAQELAGVEDSSFDTVYSSHCLEHVRDPQLALLNWWRVIKPGGHLCVAIPHEDLYEQGIVPSLFNFDHKVTFAISKTHSWSPRSHNLLPLLGRLPGHNIVYIRTIDTGYDYSKAQADGVTDQTLGSAEAAIEFVVQKQSTQASLRSALRKLVVCPKCGRLELILLGVDSAGALAVLCHACGFQGTFQSA